MANVVKVKHPFIGMVFRILVDHTKTNQIIMETKTKTNDTKRNKSCGKVGFSLHTHLQRVKCPCCC